MTYIIQQKLDIFQQYNYCMICLISPIAKARGFTATIGKNGEI